MTALFLYVLCQTATAQISVRSLFTPSRLNLATSPFRHKTALGPCVCQILLSLSIHGPLHESFESVIKFNVCISVTLSRDVWLGLQPPFKTTIAWHLHAYQLQLPCPAGIRNLETVVDQEVRVPLLFFRAKLSWKTHLELPLQREVWTLMVYISQTCLFKHLQNLLGHFCSKHCWWRQLIKDGVAIGLELHFR